MKRKNHVTVKTITRFQFYCHNYFCCCFLFHYYYHLFWSKCLVLIVIILITKKTYESRLFILIRSFLYSFVCTAVQLEYKSKINLWCFPVYVHFNYSSIFSCSSVLPFILTKRLIFTSFFIIIIDIKTVIKVEVIDIILFCLVYFKS